MEADLLDIAVSAQILRLWERGDPADDAGENESTSGVVLHFGCCVVMIAIIRLLGSECVFSDCVCKGS